MQMNALSTLNANRERPLSAGQSGTASARSWPACRPAHGHRRRTNLFVTDCPTPEMQSATLALEIESVDLDFV
jgi:hypothetical protein